MKICILYGGTSSEREVSIKTGKSVFDSIHKDYHVCMHDFDGDYDKLYDTTEDTELVFIALHGGDGENGTVQKFLESKYIKFTGSNSRTSSIAMDKNATKLICNKYDIPTPVWMTLDLKFYEIQELSFFIEKNKNLRNGLVIKPNNGGSSVGISIISNSELSKDSITEALTLASNTDKAKSIMVEEYIHGRELTVSVLDNNVLPIVEIVPKGDYYDFKSKYTKFQSDYIVPARIDTKTEELLSSYALKIHKLIGCGMYSRSDFRLSQDGQIYFLEINTLPGLTDTSLFPKSALATDINYNELINKIIKLST